MNTVCKENTVSKEKRSIRSYVSRGATLSTSQQSFFDSIWPLYGIQAPDIKAWFDDRPATEKVLELGFGDGENLFTQALNAPHQDFLGIEVYPRGVAKLLLKLEKQPLPNLKICMGDAETIVAHLPHQSLSSVLVFFPDPWPKLRHRKRRLIKPSFVAELSSRLKSGGILHLATDWEDYASSMLKVLASFPEFNKIQGSLEESERPNTRCVTKYERRGLRLGHKTWDLLYSRS